MENQLTLRFRLGSIPIVIEPWFWVMALVMGSNLRGPDIVLWVGVVFVSILVHELGHALMTRAFGATAWIKLHSFGGLTFPDRRLTRTQDVLMSLAGPFSGFALGGLIYLARMQFPGMAASPVAWRLLELAFWVNVGWGIINLLPVPPLDGGHVALALGGPRNERVVRIIAVVVAGLVVAWALSSGSIYNALLFGLLGYQNFQHVTRTARA